MFTQNRLRESLLTEEDLNARGSDSREWVTVVMRGDQATERPSTDTRR